jgi:hypothetical protein
MKRTIFCGSLILAFFLVAVSPKASRAWHDETHIAIAKVAGYHKWYNVNGADMAKIKAGGIEAHNHHVSNLSNTVVTPEVVLAQVEKYNRIDSKGHLYGAIVASMRDYIQQRKKGKYGEYHLAFCAHYVGDLSQPLHNLPYDDFNRTYHKRIDGIINHEVLGNVHKIKIYPITIHSERELAKEIARIANLSTKLGYKIEEEKRPLTKGEAYTQISHSASLFKAILKYVGKVK